MAHLLKTVLDALIEHPYASAFLVICGARIVSRDLQRIKIFLRLHTQTQNADWDGVERRGPNRAKNVIRPAFGASRALKLESEIAATPRRKTGTDN